MPSRHHTNGCQSYLKEYISQTPSLCILIHVLVSITITLVAVCRSEMTRFKAVTNSEQVLATLLAIGFKDT